MIAFIIMLMSFILENGWSLIFYKNTSLFLSVFSVISIFIVYPLYNNNNKKYYVSCFIYGLVYDIVFTNTIFLNAFIFLFIAFIISKIYKLFNLNTFNTIIVTISTIILYRFINYLIIVMIDNLDFDYTLLLKSIYSSLIVNVIYVLVLKFIVNKICDKFNVRKAKF